MPSILETLKQGMEFHRAGDFAQAAEVYRGCTASDPDHPDAWNLLGVAALQSGQPEQALPFLQQAVRLRPNTAEFHNNLGAAWRANEQPQRAIESFQQALALHPAYQEALVNLGHLLQAQGRASEAQLYYGRLAEVQAARQQRDAALAKPYPESGAATNDSSRGLASGFWTRQAGQRLVLHVGCGAPNHESLHARFRTPGWREVRLDIDAGVQPDVVASMTNMDNVPNGAVDAVWSSHNIEHLFSHEVPIALSEFRRVLRPAGLLFVTLPDIKQAAEMIAAGRLEEPVYFVGTEPVTPLDMLFGWSGPIARGQTYMAHRTGFNEGRLKRELTAAGFTEVRVWSQGYNLWGEGLAPSI